MIDLGPECLVAALRRVTGPQYVTETITLTLSILGKARVIDLEVPQEKDHTDQTARDLALIHGILIEEMTEEMTDETTDEMTGEEMKLTHTFPPQVREHRGHEVDRLSTTADGPEVHLMFPEEENVEKIYFLIRTDPDRLRLEDILQGAMKECGLL